MTKKAQTTYKWDAYVSEAEAPDFVLKVSDDHEIRITNPTGTRILRLAQGLRSGDLDVILLALTGDAYQEVSALMANAGHKALPALVGDLMEHFDLYEEYTLVGPGGGTVKAKRPDEIRKLLTLGYTIQGEVPASRG